MKHHNKYRVRQFIAVLAAAFLATEVGAATYTFRLASKGTVATNPSAPNPEVPVTPAPTITPTLSSVSPQSGIVGDGTILTIVGANFEPGATVSIGGAFSSNVTVVDTTTILAQVPVELSATGELDIVVANGAQATASLQNAYTAYSQVPVVGGQALNLNGSTASHIVVKVPAGVTVCGIDASQLSGDQVLYIENQGTISGVGGHAANSPGNANLPAQSGGAAIRSGIAVTIDNTSGYIYGGGGGGGSFYAYDSVNKMYNVWGGGGGASPCRPGKGGYAGGMTGYGGLAGTATSGGAGGSGKGGSGGALGLGGNSGGGAPPTAQNSWVVGGGAGAAVQTGGKVVTWIGGNTATRVKGAVN